MIASEEIVGLLRQALPFIEDESQRWDENSGAAVNRRVMAEASDLAARIRSVLDRLSSETTS